MALIPPRFIDCVVAVGTPGAAPETKNWIASGFLYGRFVGQHDKDHNTYSVYLVTNRHVLRDLKKVIMRFNPVQQGPPQDFFLDLVDDQGTPLWSHHPKENVDVAAIPVSLQVLDQKGMKYAIVRSDLDVAPVAKMKELGLTEGDFAYVLGFPMALIGKAWNAVIVRSGSIARIRDLLRGNADSFLVDAFIFPGNSGGPVVSKPEVFAISGTMAQDHAYLIGIVAAYLPYRDVAISTQTGCPRVTFEENSGLTVAYPIDFVEETIQAHLAKNPPGLFPETA